MLLTAQKITEYFNHINLVESLVLEVVADEQKKRVVLVLDVPRMYSDKPQAGVMEYDKEWVRYVFEGIDKYCRTSGTDRQLSGKQNNYLLKRDKRNKIIQYLQLKTGGNTHTIELDFGDFGTMKFTFKALQIAILYGKSRKETTVTWSYVDALDGKLIDYYKPFNGTKDDITN